MDERGTVLAVDDQPQNLRLLEAVLAPRGYRVLTAESGPEALTLIAHEDVDLILLDVLMPGMDGHEVCRRIRADERTAFLPIVMITASGDQERLRALESGADDFVTKPFEQPVLLARVASLSRIKKYHDAISEQARELASWNEELRSRVQQQVMSSSGWGGCDASCLHSSPTSSSSRATSRSSTAIAGRSSSRSATYGTSLRSPRRASPRKSWVCWPTITASSADSSTGTRAPWSGSRATV